MNLINLLRKNKQDAPETVSRARGELISKEFRKKYSQDDVEAIMNNYLLDPTNEKYKAEMDEMQAYRAECKAKYTL
jgi:hypothetical protein